MTDYRVVPADLDRDAADIVAVWARNLTSHSPDQHRAKFDWYYRGNPGGPGRCWLLRAGPDGRVVGTAGLGLRWLRLDGERVRAGLASDYAVDKEHRSLGPALLLQRAVLGSLGGDVRLIYGLPNRKSAPVFQRLGYRTVGTFRRYVKVLRVGRYLRTRGGVWRALAGVAPAIDLGLRAVSTYTWRRGRGRAVRELTDFDDRFDALWGRACPGAVRGERTAEFLRWRFAACPLRRYRPLGLLARGGALLGYAVVFVDDDQVIIADMLTDATDGARDDLLAGVLSWSRARGAASVYVSCLAPRHGEGLWRLGFVERPEEWEKPVVVRPAEGAAGAQEWDLTLGDEDYN